MATSANATRDSKDSDVQRSWWADHTDPVLDELKSDWGDGLPEEEARRRLEAHGPNAIERQKARSWPMILLDQFKSTIIAILSAAAVVAFVFDKDVEGLAVVAVIVANTLIGFFTELRAVRRVESLAELGTSTVSVRRGGHVDEYQAEDVVPGDVIIIEEGLEVPADVRLLETNRILADESTLTGESGPVSKNTDPVADDAPLADRSCMLYKGTFVTRGSGEAVAVETGMDTELGRISELVSESKAAHTPLERRINTLGRRLVYVTIAMAVATTVSGIVTGRELVIMIETGIALAVAAIPEGLPIVATIALARGLHMMAHRNALVNRLSSVETLGATTVICTDKTGTLTENRLTVVEFAPNAGEAETPGRIDAEGGDKVSNAVAERLELMRRLAALCTNVEAGAEVGDPLEVALVRDAREAGMSLTELRSSYPEEEEIAFDSSRMEMATIHRDGERLFAAVKGAPETVIPQCRDVDAESWVRTADEMSNDGQRVLAVARRALEPENEPSSEPERRFSPDEIYHDLELVGLIGLRDPARADVADVIAQCRRAGMMVVMVTGDNPRTATAIGREVGIIETDGARVLSANEIDAYLDSDGEERDVRLFARVTPRQKLRIVDWFQDRGEIVAMTGDGVNDAPALERADIGVAMGERGTDVAAESADMVLTDDRLASVATAVRYGRVIFQNIQKFVIYLMSCNLAEIIVVGLAAVATLPLPLRPLQILFLNVVTGVFPALALGVGPGSRDVMEHRPRDPQSPVLERRHWRVLIAFSVLLALSVLAALLVAMHGLGFERPRAVTVSFLTLAFAQLWHVFNMRSSGSGFLRNDITGNPWVWGALALCLALILGATLGPGISGILSLYPLPRSGWLLALGFSVVPMAMGGIVRRLSAGRRPLFGEE